ncbi:MAG: DUF3604 domain-containing protein [Myxococcota bacterium]|nr:DUF3604 domain-containing protein [Myxococcota bacterium]
MKWVLRILGAALVLVLLAPLALAIWLLVIVVNGGSGVSHRVGEITAAARPAAEVEAVAARQARGRSLLDRTEAPQVLFGDLHVHTHYSADAHIQAVQIRQREGPSPPADACDFARFCSQLDFWSINDHAETLTPAHWRETVAAVRRCEALAGGPESPDLVSFLGWEWSHASSPEKHYGHKNVILRDLEEGRIPTRPIASASGPPFLFLAMGAIGPIVGDASLGDWADFHRFTRDALALEDCPSGVPVRELPDDCRESAPDPPALFAKLADWGFPALVIPHGLAWGMTNPRHADLTVQLGMHDPRWQPLLEVYSGHGNSEVYRDFERPRLQEDGSLSCPSGGEGVELCCERAAALARERCADPDSAACDEQVTAARQRSIDPSDRMSPVRAVPGTQSSDWGDCGQLRGTYLPAFNYRPRGSAQYALALGSAAGEATDARFRWGFIGSSDTHRSRPGTGYREFARELMTDGVRYPIPEGLLDDRAASFYYTGGLAAVHAAARDRRSIFEALRRREVYGTSGDRILLWFDLLHPDGRRRPMGSELELGESPSFEARALGAFEQKPGCPPFVHDALPEERIASLCRGECFHPSDRRKPITRIEVVRIRPQQRASERVRPLIEDPWRSFPCPADGRGCVATFRDDEFVAGGRETLYYVRAIQAPSPTVNGDPLRCERDPQGRCLRGRPCERRADGLPDDCLAPAEERAWSSPIFLDPAATPGAVAGG